MLREAKGLAQAAQQCLGGLNLTLGKAGASLPGLTLTVVGAEGPGGCSKPHKVVSTGVRGLQDLAAQACPPSAGDGGAGPHRVSRTCSLKKSRPGESEQRPGPRDSERRPLAGRLSGPEREEAGRPGEAAAMRGLGPGLSLRQGEQLGCLEPQAPRGSWSVCLIP